MESTRTKPRRRTLHPAVFIFTFAIAGLAGNLTGHWTVNLYHQAKAQGAPEPPKVITAQAFRLVDKDGRERATLAVRDDGSPGLTLYDKDGKLRASFRLRPDGSSALSLHDADGKNRAALDTQANGGASLTMTDKNGKGGAGIVLLPDHDPALLVNDKNGKIIWAAPEPTAVEK